MLVKDVYKKYGKDYTIIPYGRPLKECKGAAPFFLVHYTTKKEFYSREVKEIEVVEREHQKMDFKITDKGLKHNGTKALKGDVYIYVEKGDEQ